jgi:hypothetical protein
MRSPVCKCVIFWSLTADSVMQLVPVACDNCESAAILAKVAQHCGFRWLMSATWAVYTLGGKAGSTLICICYESTSNREVLAGRVVLAAAFLLKYDAVPTVPRNFLPPSSA